MKKVSCIIPTYNEQARIGNVLKAVVGHPLINEIIVVDDGSSDETQKVVNEFQNVRLIIHPKNKGKSAAVCTGLKESTGKFIFLLDADLIGLTADNITSSINPVLEGVADMSINLRRNTPRVWRVIGLDYISGERVLPRKILIDNIKQIESLSGYGLEVFINKLIIKEKYRIKVVLWSNVDSPYKSKKHGFWTGVRGEIKMMRDIFKTISLIESVQQIYKMLKLRVK